MDNSPGGNNLKTGEDSMIEFDYSKPERSVRNSLTYYSSRILSGSSIKPIRGEMKGGGCLCFKQMGSNSYS